MNNILFISVIMAIIKCENMFVGMFENTAFRISVRKSQAKKFWEKKPGNLCKKVLEKNLEITTSEKSPNFLNCLEKMSLEIKSCVLDSWVFFSYWQDVYNQDFFPLWILHFHLLEDFFPGTFLYKIILEPEKSPRK